MVKVLEFEFEKTTKNTVRFTEKERAGEPSVIGTLYVQKWFAGDAKNLRVTIEIEK